jgi:hypothetical protein
MGPTILSIREASSPSCQLSRIWSDIHYVANWAVSNNFDTTGATAHPIIRVLVGYNSRRAKYGRQVNDSIWLLRGSVVTEILSLVQLIRRTGNHIQGHWVLRQGLNCLLIYTLSSCKISCVSALCSLSAEKAATILGSPDVVMSSEDFKHWVPLQTMTDSCLHK